MTAEPMAQVPEAPGKPHIGKPPTETVEQRHLIEWAQLNRVVDNAGNTLPISDLLFFIPNGGNLSKAQRGQFKAMGLKSGVSDLLLPLPRHGYAGLWIELKARNGNVTRPQRDWLTLMDAQGYATCVAYGWREASALIVGYLEGRHE